MAGDDRARSEANATLVTGVAGEISREGYRSLLSGSRDMRREHASARDAWFSALGVERKADLLFELEILLKGLACFANPRNLPGPPRRGPIVTQDFKAPMLVAREGAARAIALCRTLLGQEERVYVFQRYLEHAIVEDAARSKFVRASAAQDTPDESLLAIHHGLTHLLEVIDAICRLPRVPFRTCYATLGLLQREVARNTFFNPIRALEFRPEFDRLRRDEVFELVQSVRGDEAHQLVALSFLSIFRMLRYLALVETIATEGGAPQRAFLVLAALRSDARALCGHLRAHAGRELAEGYERELFAVGSRAIGAQYEAMLAEGHRLLGIKGALEAIAAKIRLEVRRAFEREIPPIGGGQGAVEDGGVESAPGSAKGVTGPIELRKRLIAACDSLRPALQSTIMFLCKALGSRLDVHFVFDDLAAKREVGERLRRDVWMFAQIVRGFAAKAAVVRAPEKSDRWAGVESFRFVKEFLGYFRAMGYPLLRESDYPRFDHFIDAMAILEETDLLDPTRLSHASGECEAFYVFLMKVFESISRRDELAGTPFDKKAAAEALRMYLGDGRG